MGGEESRTPPGPSPRLVAALTSTAARRLYLGLLVLLVAALWLNMVRRAVTPGGSQFRSFVEFSRDLIYRGVNVYREYPAAETVTKYPPFFGVLFAPFVPLPLWLGAALWFWVSLGLAVGAGYVAALLVSSDDAPPLRDRTAFILPLVLAAGLIASNLETAQVNHVTLFLVTLALYLFRRRRDRAAGALIGVAAALKLTPALFVLYFLYKRAYRVVAGAVLAVAVCWLLVPAILFGIRGLGPIMSGWWAILSRFLTEGTIAEGIVGFRHTNQSLSAAFHRFFTHVPADGGRGPGYFVNLVALDLAAARWIVRAMTLAVLALLARLCRTPLGDRRSVALAFEYSLVWIATLFISPISWINHYVVLLVPFAAAVGYVRTRAAASPRRRLVLQALAASVLLVSSSAWRLPQAWSIPFFGAVVLAAAIAVTLRDEARAPAAAPATATSGTSA